MRFLKITPDGVFTIEETSRSELLEFIHREIGCSCFEIVRPQGLPSGYLMIVDESGLLKEDAHINALPWFWYSRRAPDAPIVGTVLVGREDLVDGEPDVVGLTSADVGYFEDWEFVAQATLYNR